MVDRKLAAGTLLVLFFGGRFVAPVVVGAFAADPAPIDFHLPPPPDNLDVVFDEPFLDGLNQAGLFIGAGGVNGVGLVNLAHVICDGRDRGDSADQQYQRAVRGGIRRLDAPGFVQLSVANYCPGPVSR
jgi:Protein of unknown function (DUF732)